MLLIFLYHLALYALFLMKFFLTIENHKMTDKKLFILLCILIFSINSCTSIKNAVTGKKYENSDEFLIKKKNPLVLPPNFDDLPEPTDEETSAEEDDVNIEEIIGIYNDDENQQSSESSSSESTEQFVLDNINTD
jgi:hypothetical protein